MAIVDDDGERYTPTEAAKLILIGQAQTAGFWEEMEYLEVHRLTASEKRRINEALHKQYARLQRFFGHSGWKL